MKKLHSFFLYGLVAPVIALGAGSILADQTADQEVDQEQQSTQVGQDATQSSETTDQDVGEVSAGGNVDEDTQSSADEQDVGEAYDGQNVDEATQSSESSDQNSGDEQKRTQSDQDATQPSTKTTQSDKNTGDEPRMQNGGYMASVPANGMEASNLIGAEVKTSADEDVGSVSDLIIDENGQVVAVVVGVGGFLGMGERDVAIGWDKVKRSGVSDKEELRIDVSREDLGFAPKFAKRD